MKTSAQILQGVYTAAMCSDANDARYAMQTIMERTSIPMLPAVLRRYLALRKLAVKFEAKEATV